MEVRFSLRVPGQRSAKRGVVKRWSKGRDLTWIQAKIEGEAERTWLNVNDMDISFEHPEALDPFKEGPFVKTSSWSALTGTEFFSGSGRLSQALEDVGFAMTRLDRRLPARTSNQWPDDFHDLNEDQLQTLFASRYVHASFPCETYSQLSQSVHGRTHHNNFLGKTAECHLANGLLCKFYHALRSRVETGRPLLFTFENPNATFHHHPIVKRICDPVEKGGAGGSVVFLSFCAFGEPVRKNTVIVTNSETLVKVAGGNVLQCMGRKGSCSFRESGHERVTQRFDGGVKTDQVTAFPFPLAQLIANCVKKDLTKGRERKESSCCSEAGCEFEFKHKGSCSHRRVPVHRVASDDPPGPSRTPIPPPLEPATPPTRRAGDRPSVSLARVLRSRRSPPSDPAGSSTPDPGRDRAGTVPGTATASALDLPPPQGRMPLIGEHIVTDLFGVLRAGVVVASSAVSPCEMLVRWEPLERSPSAGGKTEPERYEIFRGKGRLTWSTLHVLAD